MLDRQRLAQYAPASALLLVTAFLALSLVGYDPADAPGTAVDPPNSPTANLCGPVGATIAHSLFVTVGWSSYLLLLAMLAIDVLLFRRRAVPEKGLRAVGFVLLVCVAAGLVQKFAANAGRSPTVGGGGYVGAVEVAFLEG